MRALFARPDGSEDPVAAAVWVGPNVEIDAEDESVRQAVERIFRATPVVVDDSALRPTGTSGPVELPPGTLSWFTAAARVRGGAEGLQVVFAPSGRGAVGWDPAGTYRPFFRQIERIEREQPGRSVPVDPIAG